LQVAFFCDFERTMHDKITEAPTRSEIALQVQPNGPENNQPKKRSSAGTVALVLIAAILAGGFFLWRSTRKPQTTAAAGRGGRNGEFNANQRVPVIVAAALRRDLPIYLDGLGSVDATTVTVKTRVDGQIMNIFFKEGQELHKGELLAVIDPRPFQVALAQAEANLAKDKAQLTDAKLNADRYGQLVKDGVIPQQQYDTQVALTGQLQGAADSDQAQIDSAKLNITYSQITSPIDGRVGLRLVDPGNIVHATDPNGLLVITQMEPINVVFTLPEDNLPAVNNRLRSGANLMVKAMSRDNGTDIATGTLLTIDNQIDQTTGTFKLKAVFDNKDRALWPNQFVNARLLLDTKRGATVIPSAAIQHGDQGAFVYRINPNDNTAEVVAVTVGVTEDNVASIETGLSPKDLVVTDGQDRLRAGARVDPRPDTRTTGSAPANSQVGGPPAQGMPNGQRPDPPALVAPPAGSQSFAGSNPNAGGNRQNGQKRNRQEFGSGNKQRRD
jgi:multidrug efflux system membrane fusion protein